MRPKCGEEMTDASGTLQKGLLFACDNNDSRGSGRHVSMSLACDVALI